MAQQVGDPVGKDENLVEIESDKATVELPAPISGIVTQILKQQGQQAPGWRNHRLHGFGDGGRRSAHATRFVIRNIDARYNPGRADPVGCIIAALVERFGARNARRSAADGARTLGRVGRGAYRARQSDLKEDVQRAVDQRGPSSGTAASPSAASSPGVAPTPAAPPAAERSQSIARSEARPSSLAAGPGNGLPREEEYVVMSPIRRRIAERLVQAQQTAALLTTFNEIDMSADMSAVIALRGKHRAQYEKQYGVKLGFMSFFVKAVVDALKGVPQLNAEVREPHIVYRNYYDIGIAVGGGKGPRCARPSQRRVLELRRDRAKDRRFWPPRRREQAQARRTSRRYVHDLQRRCVWLDALDADHQSAAERHPGPARHRRSARGARRPSCGPPDDVCSA